MDYLPQGTIHGVLLRSPVPSGRIVKLDVSATEQMPGVRAVVTSADMPDSLAGWVLREQPMFARDRVRYEGEPVAAVAADTLEQARQARDAIVLEIEETPAVADLDFALSDDSPLLHPDWESYVPMLGEYPRRRNIAAECISDPGGVDEAFATADRIIEDDTTGCSGSIRRTSSPRQLSSSIRAAGTRYTRPTSSRSTCGTV